MLEDGWGKPVGPSPDLMGWWKMDGVSQWDPVLILWDGGRWMG